MYLSRRNEWKIKNEKKLSNIDWMFRSNIKRMKWNVSNIV